MAVVTQTHGKYKGVIVSKTDMRKLRAGLQAKMKDIADLIINQQREQMRGSAQSFARAWVKTNPEAWQFMQDFGLYLTEE